MASLVLLATGRSKRPYLLRVEIKLAGTPRRRSRRMERLRDENGEIFHFADPLRPFERVELLEVVS